MLTPVISSPPFPYLSRATVNRFRLADPDDRVSTFDLELDASQEARSARIIADHVIVSLHDHPQLLPADTAETFAYLRHGREATPYGVLRAAGLTAVFDNLVGAVGAVSPAGWKWDDVVFALGMRLADLAHQPSARLVLSVQDILDSHRAGQVGIAFGLESASPIENELDRIDVLYGLGVRQMGIAFSDSNSLGSGLKEHRDGGLTSFGERAVRRMNDIGMAIDISHSGDTTGLDTIKTSTKPVLITHAGARGVWNTPRMKPDEVIVECARRGGVVGVEAAPHSTVSAAHPRHDLNSVMDHFTYLVELVGIDHVAFGPDTFFGDHVGLHDALSAGLSIEQVLSAAGLPDHPSVAFVDGAENPAETLPNVARWLVKHGYSDDEITAVLGENVVRVLGEIWA